MKTITLTEKEYNLLLKILKEAEEERGDMSCNDAYSSEEKMFTKEERKQMSISLYGESDAEDMNYDIPNFGYVQYIKDLIKNQQ